MVVDAVDNFYAAPLVGEVQRAGWGGEAENVGQVLPDNKGYKSAVLKATPARFNVPATLRERGECVSPGDCPHRVASI